MRFSYIGAANASTNGVSLNSTGRDAFVKKIIIGVPVASGNITIYNKATAFNADTADIAFKYTLGADIAPADTTYEYDREITLSGEFNPGLQVDGGNVQVDQAMQVTVIWDDK